MSRQLAIGDHQIGQAPLATRQSCLTIADLQYTGIATHVEYQLLQQVGRPGIRLGNQDFHTIN
jgi:hypothetical protein